MFERLKVAVKELDAALVEVDQTRLTGDEALHVVRICSEAERILAATRVLAARRVDETKAWQRDGHRSATDWMAAATGAHVKDAVGMLSTARKLEDLPLVAGAFRAGRLSEAQVVRIADAAWVSPEHERSLIAAAQTETVKTLQAECAKVKNGADPDEAARLRAIHMRRYAKFWSEPDGAVRLDARLDPEDGAEVIAAVEHAKNKVFNDARKEGRREPSQAYAADALVSLVTRAGGDDDSDAGPRAIVNVFVDHSVLTSGVASPEETCEIEGLGPISASTAQALLEDSILRVIVTDGCDVRAISKDTRVIPARLRKAIVARDRACVVPGCDQTRRLEIDHIIPIARHGPTELKNLCRLCKTHHFQKTTMGYRIAGSPGAWVWETPSDQEGARPPP